MAAVVHCYALGIGEYSERRVGKTSRRHWGVVIDSQDAGNQWLATNAVDPDNPGIYVLPVGTIDTSTGLTVINRGAFNLEGDPSGINWIAWAEEGSDPIVGSATSPWQWKDRIHRDPITYPVPMTYDFADTPVPIVNSAGDRPANPLIAELVNPYLRIARNRRPSEFSVTTAESCINSINQSSFTLKTVNGNITIPAEEAMLKRVVTDDESWQGTNPATYYFSIILEIERKGAYPPQITDTNGVAMKFKHLAIEDRGFTYFGTANDATTRKLFTQEDADGSVYPSPTPQWLNADGTKLTLTGVPATDNATLATKFKTFQRAPVKDWSSFII